MKPLKKPKFKLSVWQYLALGYLVMIVLGCVLLLLPFSSREGQATTFIGALFTSTSATCVTGLITYDTFTHWSVFGQIVILLLIQMGGLGFTTFVSVVILLMRRGLGVHERRIMMQSYGENAFHGVGKLIKRIVLGSFLVELTGALLLMIRFIPDYGALKGIYFSVFHAVSAFCNAGFDLMGTEGAEFVSLTGYAADPLVTLVISALIVVGGLGFCVWGDVIDCKFNVKKFHLYTKIVLLVSAVLLALSTVLYLGFEWNASCKGVPFGEKLLRSVFNSATARTAGFSTTDPALLSDSGYLLTLVLMFIGGSSGSTAGGIKVGTFAVIIMGMVAAFRGRKDINIGKRRLQPELVTQALAIFAAYLFMALTGTFIICAAETAGFMSVLFETVSAIGTVGVSLGITPSLGVLSQIVLILLMYAGRVGILTLALALGRKRGTAEVRKPVETLFIG